MTPGCPEHPRAAITCVACGDLLLKGLIEYKEQRMLEIELKPCPFCGAAEKKWLSYEFVPEQGHKWGRVECACGACGPEVRTSYAAIVHWAQAAADAWNERADQRG